MTFRYRHRLAVDLTGIADRSQRAVVQGALNQCAFPLTRVRKRTGKRVPVTVADLSRHNQALDARTGHGHVHGPHGEEAHLLGAPASLLPQRGVPVNLNRQAALGLYWLPTPMFPAGRVELESHAMVNAPLAQEVLLAELAHAVDYGAMTDAQRVQVMQLFDYTGGTRAPEGWFEEQGEQDYWRWRGERWMGLFMSAFAPELPRPLERQQPWQWTYDASDVAAVRTILR